MSKDLCGNLAVFSVICDPIPASLLPLKAMVSYISRTHNFEPYVSAKNAAYTQVFMVILRCPPRVFTKIPSLQGTSYKRKPN